MDKKLYDAAQLLQMLELVLDHPKERNFPWVGIKLTLRQAKELILERASEETWDNRPRNSAVAKPEPKRELKKPQPRPTSGSYGAEAPFRGTFNRIQLTDETLEKREETELLTS